jgi:uncharacterized protein YceK
MKQIMILVLLCLILAGCSRETVPVETTAATEASILQIGNPWKDYGSLEEAEAACGLDFPLNDVVADSYKAEAYRVMNGELLEVTYRDDIFEVTVRMQAGECLDLSGVYVEFENVSTTETETYTITDKQIKNGGILQLVSKDGYSYSFYAPNHYWGDSNADFLTFLNQ